MRTMTSFVFSLAGVIALLAGCAGTQYQETGQQVRLWGSSEVPPVQTPAYGTGVINIAADRSVTVTLSVIDMIPTAAHIHEGAASANGPVIVPLNKISERAFVAPDGAKLTEAQYAAYKAGNLYVNVHSTQFPNGEVRSQIAGR
jgi:CHRD domain